MYSLLNDTKSGEQKSNKQETCKSFDSCARYEVGKQYFDKGAKNKKNAENRDMGRERETQRETEAERDRDRQTADRQTDKRE